MPEDLNIYVQTASNADESSYATYCPGSDPHSPPDDFPCLGDLYSVAWMEDRFVSLTLPEQRLRLYLLFGYILLFCQFYLVNLTI